MTTVQIPSDQIPPLVQDVGLLAGLLVAGDDKSHVGFDFDWFGNVPAELEQVPSRRPELMKLLRDLLGTPAPNGPPGRSWYPLPWNGAPTVVCAVLPTDDTGESSVVGTGIFHVFTRGKVAVTASAYAPLFTIPLGSPVVITGRAGHPIELSIAADLGQDVTVDGLTFNGLALTCSIFIQDTVPAFSLQFTKDHQPVGSVLNTLDALLARSATDWINALLGVDGVKAWLDQPVGTTNISVGDVLVATKVLVNTNGTYTLGSLDFLKNSSPAQIAETLLAAALQKLAANDKPLIPFGGGGIWVFGTAVGDDTDYGLRLQVPDVDLSGETGPKVLVQIGALLSSDTADSSWMKRSDPNGTFADPGVSVTLLRETGTTPSFRFRLDLISLGIDVSGRDDKPLVNVKGVTLGAVQPRFMFSFDLATPSVIPWGIAAEADGLGIPLGNSLTGASANPVAQNLLSAGSSDSGGDKEAVNPTFSASIARVFDPANSAKLDVQLHSDGGSGNTIWIPVQRSFGPLQCRRVGIEWPDDNPNLLVDILFDGGVKLAVLAVDLEGLSIGIPLKTPGDIHNYSLDLQGLALSYQSGPLSISGGFLKDTTTTPVEYNGAALIQAATWSIEAIGSYASIKDESGNDHPSLFIFARLGGELGGPPFFFVTGLCAGFGYNRSLRIPNQNEVVDFPLLTGIDNPKTIGGSDPTPAKALAALGDWVAPAQGIDWIAAGVQFTSFELVQSNVVVTIIPTGDIQAALLGISRIKLAQAGPQFAYAELGLEVVVHPSAGFLGISAVLSPNSYIITEDCHLTGGFAFWIWYDGEHAGDFVVTLGGYHPAFNKPPHYPDEPRLGFSWAVNSNLTIQGDAYFALTPSCVMGGGALDVEFHAGDLHAWFIAHADFLFSWKPFYYLGSIGVSIGASYKLDLLFFSVTISVELGADLDIHGPPTGGTVHVSWYIISFSVSFGADQQAPTGYIGWNDFVTLLPQQKTAPPDQQPRFAGAAAFDDTAAADGDPPAPPPVVVNCSLTDGQFGTDNGDLLVRGDLMTFAVSTAFPLTQLILGSQSTNPTTYNPEQNKIAVRLMGIASKDLTSVMNVDVKRIDQPAILDLSKWVFTPTLQGVPAAQWGEPLPVTGQGANPGTPSADTLPDRLVGVTGLTPPQTTPTGPDEFPAKRLDYFDLTGGKDRLPLNATEAQVQRQPTTGDSLGAIKKIAQDPAKTARNNLFAALKALGYDAGANGDLTDVGANADLAYPDPPLLGAPWRLAA
jgi:hypothetical protein